jgi:hypothetical protein
MPHVQIIDNYSITNKPCFNCKGRYPSLYHEVFAHDKVTSSSWYDLTEDAYAEYQQWRRERNDFYCTSGKPCVYEFNRPECFGCSGRKHKWPTLSQFKKEHKKQFNDGFYDDSAVYLLTWRVEEERERIICREGWDVMSFDGATNEIDRLKKNNDELAKEHSPEIIRNCWAMVIACTPYGKPPFNWKPEREE